VRTALLNSSFNRAEQGVRLADESYPSGAHDYSSDSEELERVDSAMGETPRGALYVSAISVALLLVGWLILYFFVFIPRGTVG
jgi:hypothetical protein